MADRRLPPSDRLQKGLFTARDAYLLAYLPFMAVVARFMPETLWECFCRYGVQLSSRLRRKNRARVADDIRGYSTGEPLAARLDPLVAARPVNHHLAALQVLRCCVDRRWRPRVELRGQEHVDRALAASKGVILWILPSIFGSLVSKVACHQAGYRVSHLSRATHGFSSSLFGARVLNRIVTTAENRYLAARLVMEDDRSVGALKALVRRVREKGVVSITANRLGRRTFAVPFFNRTVRLADGAPSLAESTGATVLLVSTVRTTSGEYVTTIHPPLELPRDLDRTERVPALLRQCGALMEWCVRNWPEQFS